LPDPTLLWLRRDLRLRDHPGWEAALAGDGPVIPVFILDPLTADYGAAPKWRLEQSLKSLAADLEAKGSALILRRGEALPCLRALIEETGAKRVIWSRLYEPEAQARDRAVKAALREDGIEAVSVNAALLFEPWTVETQTGGFYKVYSPFWRAVRDLDVPGRLPIPGSLAPAENWPASDALADWRLGAAMNRGAEIVARHAIVGEDAATNRLDAFIDSRIESYKADRNRPDLDATSRLSQNLAWGEISPTALWHAGRAAMEDLTGKAAAQAEHFVKEVVWREFAYHLIYHTPEITTRNWRPEWDGFPWVEDEDAATPWIRGMTGVEMVDAAMREMYVTGYMHNRSRMVVASFLTKHMLVHWRIGEAWFRDCLIDWDPASNAMGWQWTAGSGPDAAPYFRIYNPETQAEKFDPEGRYRDRFIAEGRAQPHEDALSYFEAVPRAWGLRHDAPYPEPVIGLKQGRERALAAYEGRRKAS